ncbi:MAG: DnaJ domain protein, partial [Edafosvirus sp.]
QLVKLFYDNEDDFKNDINSLNFKSMYEHFNQKISHVMDDIELKANDINPNIYGEIKTSITNRYLNKYAKISVNRKSVVESNNNKYFLVPLRENEIIFPKQGDVNINGVMGDLIINIKCDNDSEFQILNNYDLCITKSISLYEYLYGGNFKIKHLDGNEVDIVFESMVEAIPIITIKNKGLPVSSPSFYIQNNTSSDIHYIENDPKIIQRGNLYIYLRIKKINEDDFKNKVRQIN